MPKSPKKLNRQQKEAMANALAEFFFNMFQNQSKGRANEAATLEAGSSRRGGYPVTKVVT